MKRLPTAAAVAATLLVAAAPPAPAQRNETPEPLAEVGIEQRLGEQVPLDLELLDADGRAVRFGDLLDGRPVVLVPAYYDCPMLCSMVIGGLATTLGILPFAAGEQYRVVVFSFDPRETPRHAATARDAFVPTAGPASDERDGWSFLTAEAGAIERLLDAIGYRVRFEEATGEYAHAAGVVVLTPSGRIARYHYGIEVPARDLRLALVEAADEEIGSLVDEVLLYCFKYDPTTGRYSTAVMNLVRAGGLATVLILGAVILILHRRDGDGGPSAPRTRA